MPRVHKLRSSANITFELQEPFSIENSVTLLVIVLRNRASIGFQTTIEYDTEPRKQTLKWIRGHIPSQLRTCCTARRSPAYGVKNRLCHTMGTYIADGELLSLALDAVRFPNW